MKSINPQCDWPEDFRHENGNYPCICHECERTFFGHKRRVICKDCIYPIKDGDPKLDFTDIYHYVKSLQAVANMTSEEAKTMYHILDMWEKRRYFEPVEYKLM